MKKTTFFICMLCALSISGYAEKLATSNTNCTEQTPEEQKNARQKIRSHKVAFFTEKLSLTPEEAQKFWPVYNAYFDTREQLTGAFLKESCCIDCKKEQGDKDFDIAKLSDADAKKLIADKAKLMELEKKFHEDLCKLFSPQRVLMYYCAEKDFQRTLIRRHSEGGRSRQTTVPGRSGNTDTKRKPTPSDKRTR